MRQHPKPPWLPVSGSCHEPVEKEPPGIVRACAGAGYGEQVMSQWKKREFKLLRREGFSGELLFWLVQAPGMGSKS